MKYTGGIVVVGGLLGAIAAAGEEPAKMEWKALPRGDMRGEIQQVVGVPGQDRLLAWAGHILWSSRDGGNTWEKTLTGTKQEHLIQGGANYTIFDPRDPRIFWVYGIYGGLYKTANGGAKFQQVSKVWHLRTLAIDFSDPENLLFLGGMSERCNVLLKSSDSGKTFMDIGAKLPKDTNHSGEVAILDSMTWLVSACGWARGKSQGIFRTEDAGETWTKVSDLPAERILLKAADKLLYWNCAYGGLVKSSDNGKTWKRLNPKAKREPAEIEGRLVAVGENTLVESDDAGDTWRALGPSFPEAISRYTWLPARRSFVVYNKTRIYSCGPFSGKSR